MANNTAIRLKGMTWSHDRGIAPLLAATREFSAALPTVGIDWSDRPLRDFESQPLRELARDYDLIIIDHPHIGEAIREELLVDLNLPDRQDLLEDMRINTVGPSFASYTRDGAQWALPVDAAGPIACYRRDGVDTVPGDWDQVIALARSGRVAMPLLAPHALMAFFWVANNRGLPVADTPAQFMTPADIETTLLHMRDLTVHLDPRCFEMDPIDVYEWMATDTDGPAYCPHIYGYISYGRAGFRPHQLAFANVPEVAGGGLHGTVLGGTGIAVSALSDHRDIATQFAFHIAAADCQTTLWTQSGGQPGHLRAWQDAECNALCGGFLQDTLATLNASWVRPRYDGYLEFQGAASTAISQFLQYRTSAPACADTLNALYQSSQK